MFRGRLLLLRVFWALLFKHFAGSFGLHRDLFWGVNIFLIFFIFNDRLFSFRVFFFLLFVVDLLLHLGFTLLASFLVCLFSFFSHSLFSQFYHVLLVAEEAGHTGVHERVRGLA